MLKWLRLPGKPERQYDWFTSANSLLLREVVGRDSSGSDSRVSLRASVPRMQRRALLHLIR